MKRKKFFLLCVIAVLKFSFAEDISISPKQETQLQETVPNIVKRISPSVVVIFAYDKEGNLISQGSGFFISDNGDVITNSHVLKKAYRAEIKLSEDVVYPVKKIISEDEVGDLIRISVDIPKEKVEFLPIADRFPEIGERILVIGSPFGLERTVSDGIVSAVREISEFGKIIQITASISAGSSGSPVVNMKGEVFGVATFYFAEAQNLNFAMPVKRIFTLKQEEKTFAERSVEETEEGFFAKWLNCFLDGDYEKAIQHCKEEIKKNSDNTSAYIYLAYCYEVLERWADAIEVYKQAIRVNPDYFDYVVYNRLGNAYSNLGFYDSSIEAYKQAIKIKPNEAILYKNLGLAYFWLKQYKEASSAYKQAIRINPDDAESHRLLGLIYGLLGQYQEAFSACKQAIRINPNYCEAYVALGIQYQSIGQTEEAISLYKQAIRINPDYDQSYFSLGMVYSYMGNKGSALEQYKILKNLNRDLADQLFNFIYK